LNVAKAALSQRRQLQRGHDDVGRHQAADSCAGSSTYTVRPSSPVAFA
jgi:formate dehydrogenase assembly factor FdhD